jgi:tetratricopeptide (TPR) repeat protein
VNRALRRSRSIAATALIAWSWIALVGGCAAPTRAPYGTALRISEIDHLGDPRRQASMRLVVEGLDAEIASAPERAISRYQRAIQIDPGNPFAYLALARYYAGIDDPERTLEHLDRAESLLDPDGDLYRSAEPHLRGLRGGALAEAGRPVEGGVLLEEARRLAPSVWGDGRLDASELR